MEIITFVRTGAIHHQDNEGNKGVTKAGEVQVMSAGKGIVHSEYNHTEEPLTLYQIWIEPNKHNVAPRWETKLFPTSFTETQLPLLVSGDKQDKSALFINQAAKVFGGKIKKGTTINHPITHQVYVLCSQGNITLSNSGQSINMAKGDGAEVSKTKEVTITAIDDCEIVIIDAANTPE